MLSVLLLFGCAAAPNDSPTDCYSWDAYAVEYERVSCRYGLACEGEEAIQSCIDEDLVTPPMTPCFKPCEIRECFERHGQTIECGDTTFMEECGPILDHMATCQ